jgi:AraC-like DNA-binding protein
MRLAASREPWWYGPERTGSPLLAYASAHQVRRHTTIPAHRSPALKLALVAHGSCDLVVGGVPLQLAGGRFALIPAGVPITGGAGPNVGLFLWIGLAPEHDGLAGPALLAPAERARLSRRLAAGRFQVRHAPENLVVTASDLFAAVHTRSPLLLRHGLTLCLLARLEAALDSATTPTDVERLRPAEALLDHRLDGSVRIADLARACGLGLTAFTTCCRRQTGLTPLAWVTRRRLQAARSALAGGQDAALVARHFGYPDQRHLRRALRGLGLAR